MRFGTIFNNQGQFVYIVKKDVGELDLETGDRPTTYKYERVRALLGSKSFGTQMHLHLDETMIVLPKSASLVVVKDQAYKLELLQEFQGVYIYHKDKVLGDELRFIVGGSPSAGVN